MDEPTAGSRLALPRAMSGIGTLRRAMAAATHGWPADASRDPFTVAVVEAFTNVVRHARGMTEGSLIDVVLDAHAGGLTVELRYAAEPFEPAPRLAQDEAGSGFGLAIIRKACHGVRYAHRNGLCITRLEWRRQPLMA